MSNTHKPEIQNIKVDGYNIVSYSYGKGEHVLFLLNGGPGLPCDYLRDPHIHLVEEVYRIVAFDQLGCLNSYRPEDVSLCNISRYVE